jgi:ABC-2 type transport system permease protein
LLLFYDKARKKLGVLSSIFIVSKGGFTDLWKFMLILRLIQKSNPKNLSRSFMFSILRKEFNGFLNSLIAYLVIIVFLVLIGLPMWVFSTNVLDMGFADMSALFSPLGVSAPIVFLFLIPAITMRTFAEEKKAGTMELLLTKPLSDTQIILGKYLACWFLAIFALLPTVIYYISIYKLGNPVGNMDSAGVAGSYIGLVLLAAVFTSVGVFASSISDNQIVSFILAFLLSAMLYAGFDGLASLKFWGSLSDFISHLGIIYHYNSLSKGLIDSRNVTYFVSVIVIMLMSTRLVLGSRRW